MNSIFIQQQRSSLCHRHIADAKRISYGAIFSTHFVVQLLTVFVCSFSCICLSSSIDEWKIIEQWYFLACVHARIQYNHCHCMSLSHHHSMWNDFRAQLSSLLSLSSLLFLSLFHCGSNMSHVRLLVLNAIHLSECMCACENVYSVWNGMCAVVRSKNSAVSPQTQRKYRWIHEKFYCATQHLIMKWCHVI